MCSPGKGLHLVWSAARSWSFRGRLLMLYALICETGKVIGLRAMVAAKQLEQGNPYDVVCYSCQ
jgi:hypothetical protein